MLPVFLAATLLVAPQDGLMARLKALPHVKSVQAMSQKDAYDITFEQPVNHARPTGQTFGQHIYLLHADLAKPVLLGTEGYSTNGPSGGELRHMLGGANLLTVEHRYFGKSIPKPTDWHFLTVKNAADDMHRIVTSFRQLYRGKWVATGASKGGQTALFFKCYYPNDVDATVAYVAPIMMDPNDPRFHQWMYSVGTAEQRQHLLDLQIAFLKRQDEIKPLLKLDPKEFTKMPIGRAYEYGVLEFPYAVWQYGTSPDSLPPADASAQELARAYSKPGQLFYFTDKGIAFFEAFYYQAMTELGYYNYDLTDFKPYMKFLKEPSYIDLCPTGTKAFFKWNPASMAFVYDTLAKRANRVVYIYGETDIYTSTRQELFGRTDALEFVVKGANHNAHMRIASDEQKRQFFDAMDRWLGMKLVRD